jgi:hypothetical protein
LLSEAAAKQSVHKHVVAMQVLAAHILKNGILFLAAQLLVL